MSYRLSVKDFQLKKTGASDISTLKILTGTSGTSQIYLGDTAVENVGLIKYNHLTDTFSVNTNSVERLSIDTSGKVTIPNQLLVPGGINTVWTTGKAYSVNDIVWHNGGSGSYFPIICISAHTSGTYVTDVVNGRWQLAILGKNNLHNSNFDIWQRYSANTWASGTRIFVADRWHSWNNGGGSASTTITRMSSDLTGSRYFSRGGRTTGNAITGTIITHAQEVDRDAVVSLRGKVCSLGLWIRGGVQGTGSPVVRFTTGTGTETASLYSGAYTGTTSPVDVTLALTANTWTKLSYIFTMPSNATTANFHVFYTPSGTGNQATEYIDIAQVVLSEGPAPAIFQTAGGSVAGELQMCMRYFEIHAISSTNQRLGPLPLGTGTTNARIDAQIPMYVKKRLPTQAACIVSMVGTLGTDFNFYNILTGVAMTTAGITMALNTEVRQDSYAGFYFTFTGGTPVVVNGLYTIGVTIGPTTNPAFWIDNEI